MQRMTFCPLFDATDVGDATEARTQRT